MQTAPGRGRLAEEKSDVRDNVFSIRPQGSPQQKSHRARTRLMAWCSILDAVAEQREALDYRIWREDPGDTHLAADCQTWCELAAALAAFLKAREA